MNLSILGMIDESLAAEQEARKGKARSGKYSPSSLGKCFRAQYWNRKDFPKSDAPDARTLRVFRAGDFFHDFVQETIVNKFPEIKCEVPVELDNDFFGYADMVNDTTVWELKSQHSGSFHYMDEENIADSRRPNWLQNALYAYALKKEYIVLCFISKDDLSIRQFAQPLSAWIDELQKEITVLRNIWTKNVLPPATPRCYIDKKTGNSKECSFCNWRSACSQIEGKDMTNKKEKK